MRRLTGQAAVVTGASSGIGRACAIALAGEGAKVVVNHPVAASAAEGQEVVDQIQASGGTAILLQADVSKEDEVAAMFAEAVRRLGTVDILINNAGLQTEAPLSRMTLEQWQRVIDVNLTGQFLCSREAVREFLRRGKVAYSTAIGKIICISSVHEVIPWAGHANYTASKGGVMMLMKTMAQELAPMKVRVNSVAPGAIRTKINRPEWESPEGLQALLELIPYGRIGEPEDIARAAVWLATDESDYITGATLFVDGGMTAYPAFAKGG